MEHHKPVSELKTPKAIALVGPSNSGKTQLVCSLVGWFQTQGLEVAVLKHSHHQNLGDTAKDTGRYHRAGVRNIALAAPGLLQITCSLRSDPSVEEVLAAWRPEVDLILVEGYKASSLPKIALVGPGLEQVLPDETGVVALVSEESIESLLPVFTPKQVAELGGFIKKFLMIEEKRS